MAKINRFIVSFSDNMHELGITYNENTKPLVKTPSMRALRKQFG